ncbi:MAG: hypothetical protein JRE61_15525, partial [Deltaproteobacteria bacterium]|nr:hypothetical protein [Deltaproteobacteria bacterium]
MNYEDSKGQLNQERLFSEKIRSLGICLGASTVSLVQLDQDQIPGKGNPTKVKKSPRVVKYSLHPHEGDPKRTLLSAL